MKTTMRRDRGDGRARGVARWALALVALVLTLIAVDAASAQTSQPAGSASGEESESTALLRELDGLLEKFPENLRESNLDAREVPALADRILALAKEYVTKYPQGDRAAELHYQIARFRAMNNQRYVVTRVNELQQELQREVGPEQIKAIRDDYILAALQELEKAEALSPSLDLKRKIERCRGTLYYFGNYFDAAAEVYAKILDQYPDDPDLDETLTSLVGAYEKSRRFADAYRICERFLASHMRSAYAPHIVNYKAKMLTYLGRLKEASDYLEGVEVFMKRAYGGLPAGDQQIQYPPIVRKDFETYLDRLSFQIGFAKYALGDAMGARERLEKSVQDLTEKANRKQLNQVGQVYLDRSRRVLSAVEKLQGRPAPSLASVNRWLGDRFDLEAEQGNVVALLFFPYDNPRSEEYLQAVQAFLAERWSEGFRAAWIALPKGKRDFDQQLQSVGANAQRLGLTFPTGLATYEEWPPTVYREYEVAPGTPTLVMIDRSGRVAWYKMDPTFRDFETSRVVVERLLDEPKE